MIWFHCDYLMVIGHTVSLVRAYAIITFAPIIDATAVAVSMLTRYSWSQPKCERSVKINRQRVPRTCVGFFSAQAL